jgi:hypothetical protein
VLLSGVAPDKPPLLFYTIGVAFLALGRVEIAARLAGLIAGVISVALVAALRPDRSWIAAIVMALSPFAILFSPTAFLDPLMVMFALASLVAATRRRPGWAGVLLGLAVATKVQALVFLPLVFVIQNLESRFQPDAHKPARALTPFGVWVVRFIVGLMAPLVIVLLWDRLRGGTPFWVQQTINYGGIRPIYASEVLPRLDGWASFLPYFFGTPMLIVLAVGLPLLLAYDLTRGTRTWVAMLDLMLIAFALGYFFLHWLLAFPVWDRYLLGLVPVMCLLIGRLASLAADWLRQPIHSPLMADLVIVSLVLALLVTPALQAGQSALPVGGDHGPHDGIDRMADTMRGFPYGTVIYDHWLGWTLRYYLWDAHAYIAYFATPQSLAEDLHVFGRTSPRYIVFPANESTARIEREIGAEGFALSPVLSSQDRHGQTTFTLYRIGPRLETRILEQAGILQTSNVPTH